MLAITFDTVVEALLDELPELRPAHTELTRTGDEGAYIVFDDVVYPYVEQLLDAPDKSGQALRWVFAFLERLASHDEAGVRHVVDESILARLMSDRPRLERARPFMGPSVVRTVNHRRPPWQYPRRFWDTKGRYPPDENSPRS